jgi:nitroreductase
VLAVRGGALGALLLQRAALELRRGRPKRRRGVRASALLSRPANQAWARRAPVLALGILREAFALDGRPNLAARHDLGLAAGSLLVEATARGLAVHQMIGILPERARELYAIPEDWTALTALAIGYVGDPASLPEALRERDLAPRARKPLADFVFGGRWGETSGLVSPSTRER